MIGRRRAEVHDVPGDLDAVWATDSIPIDDAPTEFDWSTSNREAEPDPGDVEPPSRRGKVIGAGIAAGLLLTVGAIVVWPNTDDEASDPGEADAPPATLSTLPESQITTIPGDEIDGINPPVEVDPDNIGDVVVPSVDALDDVLDADSGQRPTFIQLPPEIAAITTPTEIVVLLDDDIVTLSLPSGQLRYAGASSFRSAGGSMVVAPEATAVFNGTDLLISQRSGALIEAGAIAGPNGGFLRGWSIGPGGETQFLMTAYGLQGEGEELLIDIDGAAETVSDSGGSPSFDFLRSSGGLFVNDTGGVYQLSDDGAAVRVSTGRAFAANGLFVLLRECDEVRSCELVLLDAGTGDRRVIAPEQIDLRNLFGLDLAPDGGAVAVQQPSDNGGTAIAIIDFDAGFVAEIPSLNIFTTGSTWTADGAGVIGRSRGGDGLVFLDRTTGTSVDFGAEVFDNVIDIGVRYPDVELPPQSDAVSVRTISMSEAFTVPTGLDLVVLGRGDRMAYVDVDDRSATTWSVPGIGGGFTEMFTNGAEVIAATATSGFTSVLGDATLIATDDVPLPPTPRLAGPVDGTVWVPVDDGGSGVDHRLVVVGQLPAIDGPELSVEGSTLLGSDGNGNLVASIGGDVFAVSSDGSTRVTSGELLAINSTSALERSCLTDLTCSVNIVDRVTGVASPITEANLTQAQAITASRSVPISGTISPDATAFLVDVSGTPGTPGWVFVDIRNQTVVPMPEPDTRQPLVWNELSTYMAFVAEGRVYIYDRTNARISLVEGLGSIRSMVAVDSAFVESNDLDG